MNQGVGMLSECDSCKKEITEDLTICGTCVNKEKKSLQAKLEVYKKIFIGLGPWASAALSDPKCCQELKDIFEKVVELSVPNNKE